MESLVLWIVAIIVYYSTYSECDSSYGNILKLRSDLLANYSGSLRPIKNQSEAIDVGLKFLVEGVTEVNDVMQTVTFNMVLEINWADEFLQWNRDEYGLEFITIPESQQWTPRLMVLNSIHKRAIFSDDLHPYVIDSNGNITWTPATFLTIYCKLDMTNFPFDVQTCPVYLMAIDYNRLQLKLYFEEKPSLKIMQENGEWDITNLEDHVADRKIDSKKRAEISVILTLKRKSTFILLNVFLPVIVLSFLNLAVFVVPVESGEKLSYVLTVLLSLAVFISVVSGMLPTGSINIPVITIYLSLQLLISTLSVLLTVYVIRVHHRSPVKLIPSHLQVLARIVKKKTKTKIDFESSSNEMNWNIVALSIDKLCFYVLTTIAVLSCSTLLFIITQDEY